MKEKKSISGNEKTSLLNILNSETANLQNKRVEHIEVMKHFASALLQTN